MYEHGRGVEQDDVLAYMWYSLASVQGFQPARERREILAKQMTPEQIDAAEHRARERLVGDGR
jgi:TPR repeat protein